MLPMILPPLLGYPIKKTNFSMLLTVSRERHGTGDSSTESGSFSKCLLEQ